MNSSRCNFKLANFLFILAEFKFITLRF